jgi:hypothetical protein
VPTPPTESVADDYTRVAPANQLDDGIGDTFILDSWNTVRPNSHMVKDERALLAAYDDNDGIIAAFNRVPGLSLPVKCRVNCVK